MPHKTFNLNEVADYLHVSPDRIEALVRANEIPHSRQGDRLIFRRGDVDAWASQRILGLSKQDLGDYHKGSSAKVHDLSAQHAIVTELTRKEHIRPAMTSKTKASIIRDMVDLADATGLLIYREDLIAGLTEREKMGSTALAGGIALLHPPHHDPYMFEDSFVALGRTIQPVPFGSPDGRTTDLFFLICCQDDRIHLHTLARVCMLCFHTNLVMELRDADTAEAMKEALDRAEEEVIRTLL